MKLKQIRPGVWRGQPFDEEGNRYTITVPGPGEPAIKNEADAYRHAYRGLEEKIKARSAEKPIEWTLERFLDAWLSDKTTDWNLGTKETEQGKARLLVRDLGKEKKVLDLQPIDVVNMKEKLVKRGTAFTTISARMATLSRALSWGVRMRLLPENVAESIKRPPAKAHRDVWTMDQVYAFDAVLEPPYGAYLALCLWAGLRPGEAGGIKRDDVDYETGYIWVEQKIVRRKGAGMVIEPPKRNQKRLVPLFPDLRPHLERQKAWVPLHELASAHPWEGGALKLLTTNRHGDLLDANDARIELRLMCKQAGVPYIGFLGLRHTYGGVIMRQSGAATLDIARTLGHTSEKTFQVVYGNHTDAASAAAAKAAGEAFLDRERAKRTSKRTRTAG